jgi:hypothetical protein
LLSLKHDYYSRKEENAAQARNAINEENQIPNAIANESKYLEHSRKVKGELLK